MKKIVFFYNAGMSGTDTAELVEFPDDVTDEELDTYAWEGALQWAESYGVYPESYRLDDEEEDEDRWLDDTYSDNIDGYWEVYDSIKHDGLV